MTPQEKARRVSVIEKVRKLLALAAEEGGGTPAERELAERRAAEIMTRHDIAMFDVEDADKGAVGGSRGARADPDRRRGPRRAPEGAVVMSARRDPVDDLCAQLGCLDRGLCTRAGISCARATAVSMEAARPYSLRLAVWRALLRRVGLSRLLPTEPAP